MTTYSDTYLSPLGTLLLTITDDKLIGLQFTDTITLNRMNSIQEIETEFSKKVKDWLNAYFKGMNPDPTEIAIEFPNNVTEFQENIYNLLKDVSYGELISYGDLARIYKRKFKKRNLSAQAVGQALGRNPILILIPCHRVIRSDGNLGGYGAGINRKKYLINLEKNNGN